MRRRRFPGLAALAFLVAASAGWFALREPDFSRVQVPSLDRLEQELESLRGRLRIPGMSAAVAENDRIIWARGFGMANRERSVAAGPDTIYHLHL